MARINNWKGGVFFFSLENKKWKICEREEIYS
jgi:hypothetical protein